MTPAEVRLSPNFTLEEAMRSATAARDGIDNTPPADLLDALRRTAFAMEAVRSLAGGPIHPTSWYRSDALNAAVGGSETSDHLTGEAVDFYATRWNPERGEPEVVPPRALARRIVDSPLLFDQLIAYPDSPRLHIGFGGGTRPRWEVLTFIAGRYRDGLLI